MKGRRKEPVPYQCVLCGAACESWSCNLPIYCPDCLQKRRKEAARKYAKEHQAEHNARQRITRKLLPNYAEKNHAHYLKQKADPKFQEYRREYQRKYYQAHAEKLKARAKAYHQANREKLLPRMQETSRLRRLAKKNDTNATVKLLDMQNKLQECSRLHMRAMRLPCGQREECFGTLRCPKCPASATPPVPFFGRY